MAGKPKPSERIQIYLSPTTAADRLLLKVWKASRGQVHVQPLFRQILTHGLKVMHERGDLPRDVYKIKELVELLGPMPERPAHPSAPTQPMVVQATPYGYPMPAGMPMPPGYGWPMPMHPGFAPPPAHHPGAFAHPAPSAPAPAAEVAPPPVVETPFRTIPAREPDEGVILADPSGRVVPLVPEMVERTAPVVVPPPQAIEAASQEDGVTSPVPAPGVGILALMGTRRN